MDPIVASRTTGVGGDPERGPTVDRRLEGWPTTLLFAVGLLARGSSLFLLGVHDMPHFYKWGAEANAHGLAATYHGIYFPFQYQIFQVAAAVSGLTGASWLPVFRGATLVFDVAVFILLRRILASWGQPPAWALLFWCHPYYLMVSILGYIDSHFSLFALVASWTADRARTSRGYLLAGVPLGLAFVTKPQALSLVAAAGLLLVLRGLRGRDWAPAALLAPSGALFAAYTLAFWSQGSSFWALTLSYLEVPSVMPTLSANMLNPWYVLGQILEPGRPSYWVSDLKPLLGEVDLRDLATLLTLGALFAFARTLARRGEDGTRPGDWTLLFAFAASALPMLMTNAHENHLFLGTLYLGLLLPFAGRRTTAAAIHLLLVIQGLNLVGIYGLGANTWTTRVAGLMAYRTPAVCAALSAVASLCFLEVANFLFAQAASPARRGPWWRPGATLLFAWVVLYALVLVR